jgi:UDP-N-acetylmuramoylalanine--D-glutamate ligase
MDCFSKIKKKYQTKKVLILGLGIQGGGLAAADFFYKLGCRVRVSDLKSKKDLKTSLGKLNKYPKIICEFEKHSEAYIRWAEVIVRNPGVPSQSPVLKLARKLKKEIVMPTAFFLSHCSAKTIGITGTRGKSTTTNLIYQILKKNGQQETYLGGNLPTLSPLLIIPKIKQKDTAVLEISSWELQSCQEKKVSPKIAVLTNVYPDHLNFYNNMKEYTEDKMQIFANQHSSDYLVTLKTTYKKYQQEIDKYLCSKLVLVEENYFPCQPKYLLGEHNLANAALALRVAELLGISKAAARRTICNFPGLPFRLQYLGKIRQAPFFNDSTSTTPIAGIKGLQTISQKYPRNQILLVAGGKEKKLPYQDWLSCLNKTASHLFLLPGSFSDLIEKQVTCQTTKVPNLETLFSVLPKYCNQKSVVLFSPAATSFATFKNEFDRGAQFDHYFKNCQKKYGP